MSHGWVFLRKNTQDDFRPDQTRPTPLSLGNTDELTFATLLRTRLEGFLADRISSMQSGFLRGKSMIGLIAAVESALMRSTLAAQFPAGFFIDVSGDLEGARLLCLIQKVGAHLHLSFARNRFRLIGSDASNE